MDERETSTDLCEERERPAVLLHDRLDLRKEGGVTESVCEVPGAGGPGLGRDGPSAEGRGKCGELTREATFSSRPSAWSACFILAR